MRIQKLLIWASFLLISCSRNDFDNFLNERKVELSFNGKFNIKSKNENPLILLGESADHQQLIKISAKDVSDKQTALKEVKKTLLLVLGQYEFTLAPYPGQITIAADCGTDRRPSLEKFSDTSFLRAYSNERLALSICKADDYTYVLGTAFFYNSKTHKLISVDFYQQKDHASLALASDFFSTHFRGWEILDLSGFSLLIK